MYRKANIVATVEVRRLEWTGRLVRMCDEETLNKVYFNIKQLDELNFIMSLFHASTCFENKCS